MKNIRTLRLETITTDLSKSFSLLFNPRLSDLYLWHYHPEYELVYIEATEGKRRIGDHISSFHGSDLVLIGSGIPHLNWDYGLTAEYRKVVLHLRKELVEQQLMCVPEMSSVRGLFANAMRVIVFSHAQKKEIGARIFDLEGLAPHLQYIKIIELLQDLSRSYVADDLVFPEPFNVLVNDKEHDRMRIIHRYIDEHYGDAITLSDISELANMTKEAFCRYFKEATGYTFIQFLQRYRISQAKLMMIEGKSISQVCYACGFESLSYFNRVFKKVTQLNPRDFKKQISH